MRFARSQTCLLLAVALLSWSTVKAACFEPHGDLNGSGATDVVDVQCSVVSVLAVLIGSAAQNPPTCLAGPITTADVDCSLDINVTDVVFIITLALEVPLSPLIDADGDNCPDACQIPPEGFCGDGLVDPGEACDDGNTTADGNGCAADCQCENGYYGEECSIAPPPGPYHKESDAVFGPFVPYNSGNEGQPNIDFYIVNSQPMSGYAVLLLQRATGINPAYAIHPDFRTLIRAFDPAEEPILWKYVDTKDDLQLDATGFSPDPPYITYEETVLTPESPLEGDLVPLWVQIPLSEVGVYQLRIMVNQVKSYEPVVSLWLPEEADYGVSFEVGGFTNFEGMADSNPDPMVMDTTMFAYMPTHPTASMTLDIDWKWQHTDKTTGDLVVTDVTGTGLEGEILFDDEGIPTRLIAGPNESGEGRIWQFQFPTFEPYSWVYWHFPVWRFTAQGAPLILFNNLETAETVAASVSTLATGELVSHQFQHDVSELISDVLHADQVGDGLSLFCDNLLSVDSPCFSPTSQKEISEAFWLMMARGAVPNTGWALLNEGTASLSTIISTATLCAGGVPIEPSPIASEAPNQTLDTGSHWRGAIATRHIVSQTCAIDAECTSGSACVYPGETGPPPPPTQCGTDDNLCDAGRYCDHATGLCLNGNCADFDEDVDRWDVLRAIHHEYITAKHRRDMLYGGVSPWNMLQEALLWSASEAHVCNPFSTEESAESTLNPAQKKLFHRAVGAALADLLVIQENEMFLGRDQETIVDCNTSQYFTIETAVAAYAVAAPLLTTVMTEPWGDTTLGARVHAVWTRAMRRMLDRLVGSCISSATNQGASGVLSFAEFAKGAQIDLYDRLAQIMSQRVLDRLDADGTFPESSGPSPSYTGMTHAFLGHFYNLSRSWASGPADVLFMALGDSYDFMNHTVAPEPLYPADLAAGMVEPSEMVGGYNFSHRVAHGFHFEQHNGARLLLADLAGAHRWAAYEAALESSVGTHVHYVSRILRAGDNGTAGTMYNPLLQIDFLESVEASSMEITPDTSGAWPALQAPFAKVVGQDLIAIKRPGYFTQVWVGVRGHHSTFVVHIPVLQAPRVEESYPDPAIGKYYEDIMPMNGGGLTSVWTESAGTTLFSANSSPLAHHGLVALNNVGATDEQRFWEKYQDVEYSFDAGATPPQLVVTGNLWTEQGFSGEETLAWGGYIPDPQKHLPYTRTYAFYDDYIEVTVSLEPGAIDLPNFADQIVENFPFLFCTAADCTQVGPLGTVGYDSGLQQAQTMNIKQEGASVYTADGNTPIADTSLGSPIVTDGFSVLDAVNGNGVRIDLIDADGQPLAAELEVDHLYLRQGYWGYHGRHTTTQYGWVRATFDTTSPTPTLRYTITPIEAAP